MMKGVQDHRTRRKQRILRSKNSRNPVIKDTGKDSVTLGKKRKTPCPNLDVQKCPRDEKLGENERLIEVILRYPFLFNRKHEQYSEKKNDPEVWKEIGMETGVDDPERRFKNLKSSYFRIMKRTPAGEEPSSKRFPLVQKMHFLSQYWDIKRPDEKQSEAVKMKKQKRIKRLLTVVQEYPYLYMSTDSQYLDKKAVEAAWTEVRKRSKVKNPRQAFFNLKASYSRIQKRTPEGCEPTTKRFPYLRQMRSLFGDFESTENCSSLLDWNKLDHEEEDAQEELEEEEIIEEQVLDSSEEATELEVEEEFIIETAEDGERRPDEQESEDWDELMKMETELETPEERRRFRKLTIKAAYENLETILRSRTL